MKLKSIVLTLALLATIPATSFADMYCDKVLIRVGDSAGKVLRSCGEPHYRTTTKIGLSSSEEVWFYEWRNRLPYALTIRDGRVVRIEIE